MNGMDFIYSEYVDVHELLCNEGPLSFGILNFLTIFLYTIELQTVPSTGPAFDTYGTRMRLFLLKLICIFRVLDLVMIALGK
jgi:hypothetical protein